MSQNISLSCWENTQSCACSKPVVIPFAIILLATAILGGLVIAGHLYPSSPLGALADIIPQTGGIIMACVGGVSGISLLVFRFAFWQERAKDEPPQTVVAPAPIIQQIDTSELEARLKASLAASVAQSQPGAAPGPDPQVAAALLESVRVQGEQNRLLVEQLTQQGAALQALQAEIKAIKAAPAPSMAPSISGDDVAQLRRKVEELETWVGDAPSPASKPSNGHTNASALIEGDSDDEV